MRNFFRPVRGLRRKISGGLMPSSKILSSFFFVVLIMTGIYSAKADEVYRDETRAYVGFQWIFGYTSDAMPRVILGIRQTRTRTNDVVTGGDLSLALNLDKFRPDAIRISYLEGKCNAIGQYGLGYSLEKQANLFFLGVVGPYSKVFAEIDSGKNPAVGFELNTQDCAGKVII